MKKRFKILRNTVEENAAIEAGIADDPDTYIATDAEWYAVYPRPESGAQRATENVPRSALTGEVVLKGTGNGRETNTFGSENLTPKSPKKRA